MTLDELKQRQFYIGSSDVPAILGVDPYKSLIDIFYQKTGKLEPQLTTSLPAECGTYLEPGLCQWVADGLNTRLERGVVVAHDNGI
ncbi:MAG: hypothetical protein ACRCYY_10825, partial [Trueperaceae bacterium]